jgi:hypothetical protein
MDEPVASHLDLKCAPPEGPLYGRLSIAHLLLITAGSAVAIWLMQPPNGKASTLEVAISVIFAPVYGTALAVNVLAFVRARSQWVTIAEEPGHWLLIIIGSGFAGPALLIRSASWISQSPAPSPQPAGEIFLAFAGICVAIALLLEASVSLLVVLAEYRDSHRWQAVFWLLGVVAVGPVTCCGYLGSYAGGGVYAALIALLLISSAYAAAIDIRERQYRDLWHWLGVAALFAATCHAALYILVIVQWH